MRLFIQEVFHQQVFAGAAAAYSDPRFNPLLAAAERLTVQVNAENISGAPTLTVKFEHSNDDRNFKAKLTLVNGQALDPAKVDPVIGYDAGATPTCGFGRLEITMGGTGHARLTILVCGRGEQLCLP